MSILEIQYIPVPSFLTSILDTKEIDVEDIGDEEFMLVFALNEHMIDYLSNFFNIPINEKYFIHDGYDGIGQFVIHQNWRYGSIQPNNKYFKTINDIKVNLSRGDIVNILYKVKKQNIKLCDVNGDRIKFKKNLD